MGGERRRIGAWGLRLAALLGGLLAALALPPLGCPPLLWLALLPLWAAASGASAAAAAPAGALWGAAAVLVSHRWLLALHPLDWIGVPLPLSLPLCVLLLALLSALAAALVALWVAVAAWLDPRRAASALLLCCAWGLAEVLLARSPLFWIGLGVAALPGDRPLAGLAQWFGAGGLAALQLAIAWALWRLLTASRRGLWLAGLALVLALAHVGGALSLALVAADTGRSERVLVVQPAIPTRQKFAAAQRRRLWRHLDLALARARATAADLVLLPEGALGLEPELAAPAPLELISGGFRWQERADRLEQRSALLRFAPGSTGADGWLDKHRLVPLGEWVPLASLVRWSGLSAVGGLEPGPASRLLERPEGAVAGAICYELADGASLAAAVREGAGWLLASANLDPYPLQLQGQYEALAQLRAIETDRWLVSSANTGPSLLVDPRGVVRQRLPSGIPDEAMLVVRQRHDLTLYSRVGDWPLLTLGALALVRRLSQRSGPGGRGRGGEQQFGQFGQLRQVR